MNKIDLKKLENNVKTELINAGYNLVGTSLLLVENSVRETVKCLNKSKINKMEKIINTCIKVLNEHFRNNYTIKDIQGKSRRLELVFLRKCISYFLFQYEMSQKKIALELNYDNHSSIWSNLQKIKQYKEAKDKKFMPAFRKLETKINELNSQSEKKEVILNKKCKEFLNKLEIETDLLLLDDYLEFEIEGFRIRILKEFVNEMQSE